GVTFAQTGTFNKALDFDEHTYAEVPNSESINLQGSKLSVEAWIKWKIDPFTWATAHNNRWAQIIDKNQDNQYQLQHDINNQHFEFAVRTSSTRRFVQSTTTPIKDKWYHLVGVYNGSEIRIYVNGQKENTATLTGNIQGSTKKLYIGQRSDGTTADRWFKGLIDQVAIYNRSLTDQEVFNRYKSRCPFYSEKCVKMDELTKDWNNTYAETTYTSKYYKFEGTLGTNKTLGPVKFTNKSYIAFRSCQDSSDSSNQWRVYYVNSSNTSIGGNISFRTSKTVSSINCNARTKTTHNFTTDLFITYFNKNTTIRYFASCRNQTGNKTDSEIQEDPLGPVPPKPPKTPIIKSVAGDTDQNRTYHGHYNNFVEFECFPEPNNDAQTYNVTLVNATGNLIKVINDTLTYANNCLIGAVTVPFDTTQVIDGHYKINVTACDNTSLCSQDTSNTPYFTIDNTNPTITLNTPKNSTTYKTQTITFNCTATDNLGLKCMHLYLTTNTSLTNWTSNELNQSSCITGLENTTIWTQNLPDNNYLWTCRTFDQAGNNVFGNNREFTIKHITTTQTSGGGGNSASKAYNKKQIIDLNQIKQIRLILKRNQQITLKINNEQHTMQLLSINLLKKTATIKISSEPKQYNLTLHKPIEINIDNNPQKEIRVEVQDLEYNQATMFIELLKQTTTKTILRQNEQKKQTRKKITKRTKPKYQQINMGEYLVQRTKKRNTTSKIILILSILTIILLMHQGIKKKKR
ncbi:hypothetical protein B6U93_00550, partial [Candidatus Woesearchaeota archaeon ex4484_78]